MKSNDTLDYLGAMNYQSVTYSTEMKKLRAGFLIKEMLDRFKNKTLSLLTPDRTMWLYAAHGSVVSNVLNSLSLFDVSQFQCIIRRVHSYKANCYYAYIRNSTWKINWRFFPFQLKIPLFSSSILFELYQRDTEYFVQVIYQKTVSEKAAPFVIPGCGTTMCPLHRFYDLYKDILPEDDETYESLCRLKFK